MGVVGIDVAIGMSPPIIGVGARSPVAPPMFNRPPLEAEPKAGAGAGGMKPLPEDGRGVGLILAPRENKSANRS